MHKGTIFLFYALLLLCLSKAAAQSNQYVVKAKVRDAAAQTGIGGAVIKLSHNPKASYVTDSLGNLTLTLPQGNYTLELSHVGYAGTVFHLHVAQDMQVEYALAPQAKKLANVIVHSNDNRARVLSAQTSVESIDRQTALTIPAILGEVDIIKVLQLKPGVKNSGEGTSGISVRGGGTDQNLFLLDGTVVYNPNHLFGFFSTFNIDAIKDVQLYKAGFPAEFSGRLSSIVAVNTMKGTDSLFSWGAGIGIIASRLNVQGNLLAKKNTKQKLTYNIAGRRTYADLFTGAINRANKNDTAFNPIPTYYFYDLNARVDYTLSDDDQFFASLYHGRDYFKFDSDVFGSTFSWGNTAVSMHWKHRFNNNLYLNSSIHHSDYNYSLQSKFDRFDFKIKSGVKDYALNNRLIYTGLNNHVVKFGVDLILNQFAVSKFNINSAQASENLASGENITTHEGGVYVSDELDVNRKLKLNAGARVTWFNNNKTYTGFEPRLSARYLVSERFSFKASYSKMQQYKHLVASSGASLPTDIWYPSTQKIKPEISDQVSAGYSWNLNDKFLITNEVYYKWMRQLVDYKPGASLLVNDELENEFVFGKGSSYGSELSVEKTSGKLKGWVGYTLAWSLRQFAAINNGKAFYPRYDRRHELSVVASYPVSKRMIFSGSWTYYTGNAVSLPTGRTIGIDAPGTLDNNTFFNLSPVYPERGNYRMPDYHRLDIGLILKLRLKRGSADITFSAYNAYSRLNAYFISFEAKENGNGIAGAPAGYNPRAVTLFPIIPSITYNVKF